MRKFGMDVDCAADVDEARSWWKADFYDLVLINMENAKGYRDRFCDDIRGATPPQRLAFLVDILPIRPMGMESRRSRTTT
jgi:hypothetical protein